MEFVCENLASLDATAANVLRAAGNNSVWLLEGGMGSGKTTFVKAVCRLLGSSDTVNSPTFTIVNEYRLAAGRRCYHFDLYRLNRLEEALDIGMEEYIDSGDLCFVEWPGVAAPILPPDSLRIAFEVLENGSRIIKLA